MSELPDHDRIRELLKQLATAQAESERIREHIANIKRSSPEFPDRRRASRLFSESGDTERSRVRPDGDRGDDQHRE